jgi:hypothetical protein
MVKRSARSSIDPYDLAVANLQKQIDAERALMPPAEPPPELEPEPESPPPPAPEIEAQAEPPPPPQPQAPPQWWEERCRWRVRTPADDSDDRPEPSEDDDPLGIYS